VPEGKLSARFLLVPSQQRPLGALLVEMGFVNEAQLNAALLEQAQTGLRLGKILITSGIITEDRLVHALSQQLGIEACDPIMTPVHEAVLGMLPPALAFEHRILPVARQRDGEAEVLYIATADPLDQPAAEAVRQALPATTGTRWMLAGETEMDLALARHYGAAPSKSESAPEPGVRVIQGNPVRPPRRPEDRLLNPLHSTGDIFAALQDAVDSSKDLAVRPDNSPRRSPPGAAAVASGDLMPVGLPKEAPPTGSLDLPSMSLDLPIMSVDLPSEPDDQVIVADEVVESGAYDPEELMAAAPPPDAAPPPVEEAGPPAEPVAAPVEPVPAPVVPAPVVPVGPSWGDMLGADDESQDISGDIESPLSLANDAATVLPAATDSLPAIPAPDGPPEPSGVPAPAPEPPQPAPTELDLNEPALSSEPASEVAEPVPEPQAPAAEPEAVGEPEPEPADEIADVEPEPAAAEVPSEVFAPPPEPEPAATEVPSEVFAPPPEPEPAATEVPSEAFAPPPDLGAGAFAAEPESLQELGLDGLPMHDGDPFAAPELTPAAPDAEGEAEQPNFEVEMAKGLIRGFVAGAPITESRVQWILRLMAGVMLETGALKDADLERVIERIGPAPD